MKLPRWIILLVFGIVFIGILVLSVFFCFKPSPVKIGFVSDLSGRQSNLGVSARNGAILAVEHINKRGGIGGQKIVLFVRDNRGNAKQCESVGRELTQEGVLAIVGPLASAMAEPVIKGTKGGALVISPTASTNRLAGLNDNFIRIIALASQQGELLARQLVTDGARRVAVVFDKRNLEYTLDVLKGIKDELSKSKVQIVGEVSFSNKSQYRETAQTISVFTPDAILFIASGIDAGGIVQQFAKQYSVPRLYGSMWTMASGINQFGGKIVENMVLVAAYSQIPPGPKYKAFSDAFERRFNDKPGFAAQYAYEATLLLEQGMNAASSMTVNDIKKAIINMKAGQGLFEEYHFDSYGDVVRPLSLYRVKNGEYQVLKKE